MDLGAHGQPVLAMVERELPYGQRIAAATDGAPADEVIDNGGSPAELPAQVDADAKLIRFEVAEGTGSAVAGSGALPGQSPADALRAAADEGAAEVRRNPGRPPSAQHFWVRGHWADYRAKGLFGRTRGLFYFSEHQRGCHELGSAYKTHSVEVTA